MPEPSSREDAARIADLIRALGNDESERRRRLGPLLESIEHAHGVNPAGWSLTVSASRRLLNLNAGRALVHCLFPDQVWLTVEAGKLDPEIRRDLDRRALEQPETFDSLPGVVCYKFRSDEDLQALWSSLRPAHFAAIDRAAKAVARTPYFTAHSPTLAAILGEKLDREVPHPDYGEGTVTENRVAQLLELVRSGYPDWDGFTDPAFVADEIDYKQATVSKTRKLLGRRELEQLVESGDFGTFLARVEEIGRDNNLLFISVPLQGDLNIL